MRNIYGVAKYKGFDPFMYFLDYDRAEKFAVALAGDDDYTWAEIITAHPLDEALHVANNECVDVLTTLSELERCARSTIL